MTPAPTGNADELRSPESFASIDDPVARSQAMFTELDRVLSHPRCLNCHPSDRVARQGDDFIDHDPPVYGGTDGRGVAAMECVSCHQDKNLELARVPGAPNWHLAPIEMAWLGKSPSDRCTQLRDPQRNGGKDAAALVEHARNDAFIAWGFNPGHERTKPPGKQLQFANLVQAWLDTGGACPPQNAPHVDGSGGPGAAQ